MPGFYGWFRNNLGTDFVSSPAEPRINAVQGAAEMFSGVIQPLNRHSQLPAKVIQFITSLMAVFYNGTNAREKVLHLIKMLINLAEISLLLFIITEQMPCNSTNENSYCLAANLLDLFYACILGACWLSSELLHPRYRGVQIAHDPEENHDNHHNHDNDQEEVVVDIDEVEVEVPHP